MTCVVEHKLLKGVFLMQNSYFSRLSIFAASVATAAFMLGGCSDGKDGLNGKDGKDGLNAGQGTVNVASLSVEDQAKIAFKGEVTSVTINSPPVVNFKVTDASGNPVVGLGIKNAAGTALNNMAFALAKLVPGTNGSPSKWVSYIVTTTATPALGSRPTTDTTGTLVDNGDGTYQYTFYRDITKVKDDVAALTDAGNNRKADLGDLTYDPTLTHRLAIQIGGTIINTSPAVRFANPINIIYDFIPATGKVVTATDTQREIVTTTACNECHGETFKTAPHTARTDARYCVVCHTSQRAYGRAVVTSANGVIPPTSSAYVVDGEVLGDFPNMIHKIHAGSAIAGTSLSKTGYNYAGFNYEKITGFPMSPANCRVCHKAENSLQGDNWNLKPSRQACGSCHDGVNFATGAGHSAGNIVQANDASCATACHNAAAIKGYHMGVNKTANNPDTPAGLVNFTYEVSSADVNATTNDLTIKFRILGDGTPVTFVAPAAGVANPLSGFTGSPSFLLAYAKSQDGIAAPADYNNFGRSAAQPASISIASLLDTANSATRSLAGPDASGYYTATIKSAAAFPADAKLRAVALQGYFTQVSPAEARHTVSVIKNVTGDATRRTVVDPAKCGKCHEWFEGHGGNRVYETQVCVTCHNPNLSTSGRVLTNATLSGLSATQLAMLTSIGYNYNAATPNYALAFPETTNNFKEMIHGIHAGKDRTNPFVDVRGDRFAVIDASHFTFPNLLKNCEACHVTPPLGTNRHTYKADLPAGVLATTNVTRDANGEATVALKRTARTTVPNAQDLVSGAILGACVSCHDSAVAKAHMASNGGQIDPSKPANNDLGVARSSLVAEQCALCHGEGKTADAVKAHAK